MSCLATDEPKIQSVNLDANWSSESNPRVLEKVKEQSQLAVVIGSQSCFVKGLV